MIPREGMLIYQRYWSITITLKECIEKNELRNERPALETREEKWLPGKGGDGGTTRDNRYPREKRIVMRVVLDFITSPI